MDSTENNAPIPQLPDEAEYPAELTRRYELLECFSDKEDMRTLLAADRESGESCVVKCYLRASPLYDHSEPEALRTISAAPLPRFLAEYHGEQMRCVLRQYVPGETLSQLAKDQTFTEEEVIRIGLQLCDQLHALHSMTPPVIHRDIKPQNVVLRPDGTAVLIDFGIARVRTENGTDTVAWRVYAGTTRAARETAELLFALPGGPEQTPLLDDVPLRPFRDTGTHPLWLWQTMAELQWRAGSGRQPETRAESLRRAGALLDLLEKDERDSVVICRGLRMRAVKSALRSRGYLLEGGDLRPMPLERIRATKRSLHCGGCAHNCLLSEPKCQTGANKTRGIR